MGFPFTLAAATSPPSDIAVGWLAPFALLLLLIAAMPLATARVRTAWEHTYGIASLGLGGIVAAFYLLRVPSGATAVGHMLAEYFSFISLIASLYVIAGGIHLKVRDEATPWANIVFLLIGAVAANIIGTTGASMVLIRPWIRMNKIRISAYHVVFFIFIVSNIGGALTPIGDPPLFLGYLRGIPFFWLIHHVIIQWIFTVAATLAVFYFIDRRSFRRVSPRIQREIAAPAEGIRFDGRINLVFLAVVVVAVFIPDHYFLREAVMLVAALVSYRVTAREVHAENRFSFGPIREVAVLFAGIFATMMPALNYVGRHGAELGVTRPSHYYVATGLLSSVLDNAPTYATFLRLAEATAQTRHPDDFPPSPAAESEIVAVLRATPADARLIVAVSLGAVFFGAMTYIGNGPNFMVKSIAENAGVRTPHFFAYIFKYSLPLLLPILLLSGWLFL